jgi:Phosphodiester glycosidase
MIIVAFRFSLCLALMFYGLIEISNAHQQRHVSRYSDGEYPFQLIPISSQTTLKYTMWTPQNWSKQITDHQSNHKLPPLHYNAYLVTTSSSKSFQVIFPSMVHQSTVLNAIRIDTKDGRSKSYWHSRSKLHSKFQMTQRTSYNPTTIYNRLQRTSEQSLDHHCMYAMNGGPFHSDGSSVGVVVVQDVNGTSQLLSNDFGPNIGIGIAMTNHSLNYPTKNNSINDKCDEKVNTPTSSSFWVIGRLANETQVHALNIQQFVTGFDWLVYNYTNIVHHNISSTTTTIDPTSRASRSTIGITSDGKLLLFVTDGCEHWFVEKTQ